MCIIHMSGIHTVALIQLETFSSHVLIWGFQWCFCEHIQSSSFISLFHLLNPQNMCLSRSQCLHPCLQFPARESERMIFFIPFPCSLVSILMRFQSSSPSPTPTKRTTKKSCIIQNPFQGQIKCFFLQIRSNQNYYCYYYYYDANAFLMQYSE